MRLEELDYDLPKELIAQEPARPRDASRLLVLHRASGKVEHRAFPDLLEYLLPTDVVVMNDTRVIPARLFANLDTADGKSVEVLLLRQEDAEIWQALVKPAKKAKAGVRLVFEKGVYGEVLGLTDTGSRRIRFSLNPRQASAGESVDEALKRLGNAPLPPYITAALSKPDDYQTVYASQSGSVAAPTAGLHFTPQLLDALSGKVAAVCYLTLHIGPATFRPIRSENVETHPMLPEWFSLAADTADIINRVKRDGGRIVAVGTSTCRVLESCADEAGLLHAAEGETSLFITQGSRFRVTDVLLTNFHLPKSTNLLLAIAFAGKKKIFAVYEEAVSLRYRFYSFGDAMLIV